MQDLIRREDSNTSYNDLASVNKALQMVAVHLSTGDDSDSLAKHREKLPTYLWQSDEGMTSCATNGLQVWDTAFTVLAVIEAGLVLDPRPKASMVRALMFLEMSQLGIMRKIPTVSSENEDGHSVQRTMVTSCRTTLQSP